jgi:hypothetical protein
MAIKVLHHGLATTVQDLGRPGYFHLGIPVGGAMDRYAMRAANLLVGNDEGAAGLEAVFIGPKLEFTEDALGYRNARYLNALTRIEAATSEKEKLWALHSIEDSKELMRKIFTDGELTENEKIRLTESW